VKFGFVAKHRKHRRAWPVLFICEALGVSRSGFYAWRGGPAASAASMMKSLVVKFIPASWAATGPTARAAFGMTCWRWVNAAACIALSDSCGCRRCGPGHDAVGFPRIRANAASWRITCWTGNLAAILFK